VDLLWKLREDGYLLGLLSNNPASLRQRVGELMPGLFHAFVISGEDGVMKPGRAIYDLAVQRLGVEASTAVFIDDYEANIVGARQAGLNPVLFRGLAPLRRDLSALGVRVPRRDRAAHPAIQAVIFDWGGVLELLPDKGALEDWAHELDLSTATLREALWGADYLRMSSGWISSDEYVRRVDHSIGRRDPSSTRELLQAIHAHNRLDSRVLNAVRRIREGRKVALLTNAFVGHDAQVRAIHGIDISQEFDLYINSAEVGLRKPDPAIYQLALERLEASADRALYIDDGLRNTDGAGALGMHTIQHVGASETLHELESILALPLSDQDGRVRP
jgi:putative hydrolase of the HAD superfamily